MDAERFDRLTKTFSTAGTRRGVLRLVAAVPLAGLLIDLLGEESAAAGSGAGVGGGRRRQRPRHHHRHHPGDAKRRHHRRRDHHNDDPNRDHTHHHKNHKTRNRCQGVACDPCFTCDAKGGACVADASQVGQDCGQPGQVCQSDGRCVCDTTSCPECQSCGNAGVCEANANQVGKACGQTGQVCQGDGSCVCDATSCGACQTCDAGSGECVADTGQNGQACGAGGDDSFCCANGVCPQPSGCLSAGSACGPTRDACLAQCCTQASAGPAQGNGTCLKNVVGPCESDLDCDSQFGSVCHCGGCCVTTGSVGGFCPNVPTICCSGRCNGTACA